MLWTSTRNRDIQANLNEALFKGLAPDGGLFIPNFYPNHSAVGKSSLIETAVEFLAPFTDPEIDKNTLRSILTEALNFDIPVVKLSDDLHVLELFHGPTLAFKDVGGRVMAGLLNHVYTETEPLTILAATSGDTGSAVASAFLGKEKFRVVLLFPSGQVSEIQERQLTTFGQNVTTLEVKGTFDDCQKLVKDAFSDSELRKHVNLTSANSINIGRWLPQTIYYLHAWNQMQEFRAGCKPLVCVPSGNLGNIAAGLVALFHGADFTEISSACNANKTFYDFIETGKFRPRSSVRTCSNAMDVGNPSNFERIHAMFDGDLTALKKRVSASSHSDEATQMAISHVYGEFGYIMDPHTAVGYLGLQEQRLRLGTNEPGLVLSTAHPAKFGDVIASAIGIQPEMPDRLAACFKQEKKSILLENDYAAFTKIVSNLS
jgi:threonine synthase